MPLVYHSILLYKSLHATKDQAVYSTEHGRLCCFSDVKYVAAGTDAAC